VTGGLPRVPNAEQIDVDADGRITGSSERVPEKRAFQHLPTQEESIRRGK